MCQAGEARTALLESITAYGRMGAWKKGQTKTGEMQELPLSRQAMAWIQAWKAIRPYNPSPYLFPGQSSCTPLTDDGVRLRWSNIRTYLGIHGFWTYDLRRTLACYLGNELNYDDHTIRAILNHYDGTALGRYFFKSFDAFTEPIQQYADWLMALKGAPRRASDPPHSIGARGTAPVPLPVMPLKVIPRVSIPRGRVLRQ